MKRTKKVNGMMFKLLTFALRVMACVEAVALLMCLTALAERPSWDALGACALAVGILCAAIFAAEWAEYRADMIRWKAEQEESIRRYIIQQRREQERKAGNGDWTR